MSKQYDAIDTNTVQHDQRHLKESIASSSGEESTRDVNTADTDKTIVNEISINQFFYRGKMANAERVFSPLPKRRKRQETHRPVTNDPRNSDAANNIHSRPATAPAKWGFSNKRRWKQTDRPTFSNDNKETFAE